MNVLVIGYGSIGARHVANLDKMDCVEKIFVLTAVRPLSGSLSRKVALCNSSMAGIGDLFEHKKIDFAVVANETHKHVQTAVILAEHGCHVFLEKPLSHSLDHIGTLREAAEKTKSRIYLAYNLRFLPAIKLIGAKLSQKCTGRNYYARIEVGQFLPSWRRNIAYENSYSASSSKGGGVALDLSHEIDYMTYLFGMPRRWKTFRSKVSDLRIDSCDVFEGIYQYEGGFLCHVHMDYFQQPTRRTMEVIGSKGAIRCDFVKKRMEIAAGNDALTTTDEHLFDFEKTYVDEMMYFIDVVKTGIEPFISIDDGIRVLKLLEDNHD